MQRSTRAQISAADAAAVRQAIEDFDRVLGVVSLRQAEDAQPPVPVEEIERLIEERQAARQRRDFAAADGIRQRAGRIAACCSRTTRAARAGKRNEHDDERRRPFRM